MRSKLIILASIAILPSLVHAQGRAGVSAGMSAPRAMPHAASAPVAHAAPSAAARSSAPHGVRPNGGVIRTVHRPVGSRPVTRAEQGFAAQDYPVPGLGFDYTHFAAVHGNDAARRRRAASFFFPFFDGGYYPQSAPPVSDDVAPADSAQYVYADDEDEPAPRLRMRSREPLPQPEVSSEPQGPQQEYVFVKRDGTVFFAIGYSWDQDLLRYVTSEGVRHTTPRDTLDLTATQEFNEQRGLSFR